MALDKRKVQLIGGSTYIVSLPKKWVKGVGIKKRSEVALVRQRDGSLVIVPDQRSLRGQNERTIRVSPETNPRSITRSIISSYLNGSDSITVLSSGRLTPAQLAEVKRAERKLIGLETVEESARHVLLGSLLNLEDLEVRKGIRRMHVVASLMQKEAMEALFSGNRGLTESAISRDDDVDRLYFLALRQLRQAASNPETSAALGMDPIECLDLQSVAKRIEHIADHAENVARNVQALLGHDLSKGMLDGLAVISRMAQEIHEGAGKSLLEGDLELANHVLNERITMKGFCAAFRKRLPREGAEVSVSISSIVESLERIADYGTDIAEVAINRAAFC